MTREEANKIMKQTKEVVLKASDNQLEELKELINTGHWQITNLQEPTDDKWYGLLDAHGGDI